MPKKSFKIIKHNKNSTRIGIPMWAFKQFDCSFDEEHEYYYDEKTHTHCHRRLNPPSKKEIQYVENMLGLMRLTIYDKEDYDHEFPILDEDVSVIEWLRHYGSPYDTAQYMLKNNWRFLYPESDEWKSVINKILKLDLEIAEADRKKRLENKQKSVSEPVAQENFVFDKETLVRMKTKMTKEQTVFYEQNRACYGPIEEWAQHAYNDIYNDPNKLGRFSPYFQAYIKYKYEGGE